MKTPCVRPGSTPMVSPADEIAGTDSTAGGGAPPLPQTQAPEPFTPLSPVGELYNKLFGDESPAPPPPSLECTIGRLGRPPSGESLSRHAPRARAGASRTDIHVERMSEVDESVTAMTATSGQQRKSHRKSSNASRKKQMSGTSCNSSPSPQHQKEPPQEAVIVPSRRKTRSMGLQPSNKSCDFRAMTTDAPMDVELSTQFRPPSSRYEAPTRDRVMGGSGNDPIPKPPEEQFRSRDVRAEDGSQEHIFGASEQMMQRGVKEWPVTRSHKLKYRPRPGDDSQNKVCWWLQGSSNHGSEMDFAGEGEGRLRSREFRRIPPDSIHQLLDDECAAKAAAEYLAAERERRIRKRLPLVPHHTGGLVYTSYDVAPDNETETLLAPIISRKVLSRRSYADSQKRLFGAPEERDRRKSKGQMVIDTKGRLFGDAPVHIRRYSSRPGAKTHNHSSIFGEDTSKPPSKKVLESKMPLSARGPNRNPISGEGLTPSSRSSTLCTSTSSSMKQSGARGNPISGEGVPTPRAPVVSIRQASDSRCNPITGEGYNKNRREIWVTTCRI